MKKKRGGKEEEKKKLQEIRLCVKGFFLKIKRVAFFISCVFFF